MSTQLREAHGDTNQPHWYAIYTRSRHEKVVAQELAGKQINTFLPLHQEVHRWKDRYRKVRVPLFNSYVFAQWPRVPGVRLSVLQTHGVVRIVGFGQQDAPVPDEQIHSLRQLMESPEMLYPHRYLRTGQRVRVVSGALAGVEGILVRVKNLERLVIAVEPIRQAVALELSGYEVVPVL